MKLAIFGSGGLGRVVAESVLRSGEHDLTGFIDDSPDAPKLILGLETIGTSGEIADLMATDKLEGIFIAIGSNTAREKVAARIASENPDIKFPTIIDAAAIVSPSARLGSGCFAASAAIIGPGAVIGSFSVINTAAVIEHDSVLEDCCYVGPKALVDSRAKLTKCASLAGGKIVGQDQIFDGSDIYAK